MKYTVIFEPDLPGCVTTGKTRQETVRNMAEAIHGHLTMMREEGLPIPEPTTEAGVVEEILTA